jgi:pectin methylesterase-like acyl-CoA thioesterase
MRRSVLVLCVGALLGVSPGAQAQQNIVAGSRAIDWSTAGVTGGIPNRTTICATLNPGATAAQINSAISSCPAGQVVKLNAGTYNIGGVDFGGGKSNVTLRGAGADQTFLVFNNDVGCHGFLADVCMESSDLNWRGGPSNLVNWYHHRYARERAEPESRKPAHS